MDERGPQRLRHLHRYKAPDRKRQGKQEKAKAQTLKTDPLISCFSRHLEIEKYSFSMHGEIVWTDTDKQKGTERQR